MKNMNQGFCTERLLHGGDYNPEQWLDRPDILKQDVEYFKKAGINTVSLGMFSWTSLEPEEGNIQIKWLEDVINRLYENGISTILATPSGARPKWLADKYPEVLRVDGERRRALFGGRHDHCYTSPVYRQKVKQINTQLVKHLGGHPGVILWHISNEYGGECHCPLCQEEFRKWLKEQYGTIGRLNDCWCTTFWSHTYQSFDQVESPSPIGEMDLHGLNLDWKRFVTDRTVDFLRFEIQTIREAGNEKPVTTNFMYDFLGLNYRKFKDDLDVICWDNYPAWHKKAESQTALDCGFQHDFMRSVKHKPFLLMESCPGATNWQPVSKTRRPGMIALSSLQAVAHGSDSVLYFQLRQSRGASEKFHGAVIDHYGGDDTRVFREVSDLGRTLKKIREVAGASMRKEAAILCDTESRWAMEDAKGPRNEKLPFQDVVLGLYGAVRSFGVHTDVIDMEDSLDGYKLVIAPMLYLFRKKIQEKLADFVKQGGTLIMTFWSGVVDEHDRCFLGPAPGGLTDVLGLRFAEIDGLYDGESNRLVPVAPVRGQGIEEEKNCRSGNGQSGQCRSYSCHSLCELVRLSTAMPLMVYGEDFYAGEPAFTCNTYGLGKAYYLCTAPEPSFYRDLMADVIPELFPERPVESVPEGLEVTVRDKEDASYLFLQNFNREPVDVEVTWEFEECLCGEFSAGKGGRGTVKAFDTVVLKRSGATLKK